MHGEYILTRRRDHNGRPIGIRNSNPILDTREYDVLFPDSVTQSYSANVFAENLYSQVDAEGRSFTLFDEILDHKRDDTAITDEMLGESPCFTMKGWHFLVQWKDGSSNYVPLREMKASFPLETAEYAISHQIAKEPAFRWWVPYTLRKRECIISKLSRKGSKYWQRTHKYGIELPKSVKEALEIDRRTGTTFWRDAIEKEMKNNAPAFKFNDDDSIPIGYKHITCHMIFDIKMVGLVWKARFVAGGRLTDPPVDSVYSSVVTKDSVRILFTIAALNDLEVIGADVQNAYINAPTKEKVYATAGPEFGSNQGQPVLIVRALYGLKSSGARWHDHLAAILCDDGFKSSLADPDVWMRKARKPCGFLYWEYLLAYVDDILILSHAPHAIIDSLSQCVAFKPGSVEPPKSYLGADVFQVTIHDGDQNGPAKHVWAMSATEYVKRAIQEVERELALQDAYLPKRIETPLSSGYRPELDFSPELEGRRSRTGLVIYLNKAPVIWYSKRQNTVEAATFGSEFIALKTAIDQVEALWYKLRMFGIPINGPTSIFCDNESVVINATHSESPLRRKHAAIAYHRCREAQAAGHVKIGWQDGQNNPADVLTKLLFGPRLRALLKRLFYWCKEPAPV
jgi:hypothetical protein